LSVAQAAIYLETGEKAYTVHKSDEIFNAAKVRAGGHRAARCVHGGSGRE
jgi:hypothetical protein